MLSGYHPVGALAKLFTRGPDTAGSPPPLRSYGRTHSQGERLAPYYLPGFSPPSADPLGEALRRQPVEAAFVKDDPAEEPAEEIPTLIEEEGPAEGIVAEEAPQEVAEDISAPKAPVEEPAEEISREVFRARPVVDQIVAAAADAARRLESASPDSFSKLGDELIAGQAAQVLMHLRREEWNASGSYKANLFVLSYELFSDGAGELIGKASELSSRLEKQGLVCVHSDEGVSCVSLSPQGRTMADRMLSPLSREGEVAPFES